MYAAAEVRHSVSMGGCGNPLGDQKLLEFNAPDPLHQLTPCVVVIIVSDFVCADGQ